VAANQNNQQQTMTLAS